MDPTDGPATPPALVAVGGSAGSLEPLITLVRALPANLDAAVLVAIHIGENSRSQLPDILSRSGPLPAVAARDGQPLEPGRIHVAPPGRHLLADGGAARLSAGPRVNRHRPAVDVLFASVAEAVAGAGVAVVLSGVLDDGAVGAALIARAGGRVLVQDPDTADFPGMPAAARTAAPGAVAADPHSLAGVVARLVVEAAAAARPHQHLSEATVTMAESGDPRFLSDEESQLTRLACPECGGALAEVDLPQISYFRCHVGHHYGPQTLAAAQAEAAEAKLWSAVAALDEQAALARYLGRRAGDPDPTADDARVQALVQRALALREQVQRWTGATTPAESPGSDGVVEG